MKPELKSCPFCGGKPSISKQMGESLWSHNIVLWTGVQCDECEAQIGPTCEGYEIEAVDMWNRRASSEPQECGCCGRSDGCDPDCDAARPAEPMKVPSDEIVEAVEAYGRAYSMPNTTASELSIRLHEIRALLAKYSEQVGKCSEHHAKCSEVVGYAAEDMASQGAQGFRDGYAAALDEMLKALEHLYTRAMAGRLQGDDLDPHDEMYNVGQLGQAHGISQAKTAIMSLKANQEKP